MTWVRERQGRRDRRRHPRWRSSRVLIATGEKESLVIGVITGAAYGLLALGLVLIYKSSGVFNFAQGEFGTVAVYTLYLLHFDVPYGVAIAGRAGRAAVIFGVLVERLVVRPLFEAPRVIVLVATAGVALLAIAVEIWFGEATGSPSTGRSRRSTASRCSACRSPTSASCCSVRSPCSRSCSRCSSTAPTSAWPSSARARSRRPPSWSASASRRLSTLTWALAALLGGLAGVLAVPEGRQLHAGHRRPARS